MRIITSLERLILDPHPLRTIGLRFIRRFNLGSYAYRLQNGVVERPHYGYCLFQGARLAKKLGHPRVSVLEFGVAGGRGLLSLEYHAAEVSRSLGIEIDIYGFDTGKGLPVPVDYRDLPYHWKEGFYSMDRGKLEARLKKARLVIGDIRETAPSFCAEHDPAPIAAMMHDFDFYSSTAAALRIFEAPERYFLPRVFCYFDDIVGDEIALYNDYTGERLAINEFNATHATKKIAAPAHFLTRAVRETWHSQIFVQHDFAHSRYNDFVGEGNDQLPLLDS
ncbi:MAG: hypothetical protein H0T60_02970 [Acidobacteria bacterium]|nr:hypothetical protein [Acidobacteriota bacterium]